MCHQLFEAWFADAIREYSSGRVPIIGGELSLAAGLGVLRQA
jgi:hypothetical protein